MITLAKLRKEEEKGKGRIYFQWTAITEGEKRKVVQVRQMGKIKTWKKSPENFSVPVCYGLRDHFYITNFNHWEKDKWVTANAHEWKIANEEDENEIN